MLYVVDVVVAAAAAGDVAAVDVAVAACNTYVCRYFSLTYCCNTFFLFNYFSIFSFANFF